MNGKKKLNGFADILSTHGSHFNEGRINNLENKGLIELHELLARQEKISSNRQFLLKLPDKGDKILKFIEKIKETIEKKELEEIRTVKPIEDIECTSKTIVENELQVLEKGFGNLRIHEGPHYDVIKKANEKNKKPSKFILNRNSEKLNKMKSEDSKLTNVKDKDRERSAVVISVEESRILINSQQKSIQEHKANAALEKMMSKYGIGSHDNDQLDNDESSNENDKNIIENSSDVD